MKKVILSLVAAVFAVSTFAQEAAKVKKTPEEIANRRADKLKTELALSDEQRGKIYSFILDRETKTREIRAKYPNDENAARTEIKQVNEACDTSIKSVLTPEQITKWEALKKERMEKHKEKKKDKDSDD